MSEPKNQAHPDGLLACFVNVFESIAHNHGSAAANWTPTKSRQGRSWWRNGPMSASSLKEFGASSWVTRHTRLSADLFAGSIIGGRPPIQFIVQNPVITVTRHLDQRERYRSLAHGDSAAFAQWNHVLAVNDEPGGGRPAHHNGVFLVCSFDHRAAGQRMRTNRRDHKCSQFLSEDRPARGQALPYRS